MAAFYADENFRYPVVAALRRLGHDVLTCQEAGRADQGIDDEMVLSDALRMGRILLTQNRDDFKKLHKKWIATSGYRCLRVRPRHRSARAEDQRCRGPRGTGRIRAGQRGSAESG